MSWELKHCGGFDAWEQVQYKYRKIHVQIYYLFSIYFFILKQQNDSTERYFPLFTACLTENMAHTIN